MAGRTDSESNHEAVPTDDLTDGELVRLIARVFRPGPGQQRLLILADLPDRARPDHEAWSIRRALALDWARRLGGQQLPRQNDTEQDPPDEGSCLEVDLLLYRNVRANNADLPSAGRIHPLDQPLPATADTLEASQQPVVELAERFASTDLVLAPTELSTTAPLKLAARQFQLRAATMPGFMPSMVPALRLDYGEVDRRVRALAQRLDQATGATVRFLIDRESEAELFLDLRFRAAHASGGLLREIGTAGNLPSGEAYIVPYEGERAGDPSRSHGILPVQLGDDVVRYRIVGNRAVTIEGDEPTTSTERDRLAKEPAYGNLAELGLGVLAAFGIKPIGAVLLDEKLGPHIAFGRSDHFGGHVGPGDFSAPERVVHIDRVYLPETQPRVALVAIDLHHGDQPDARIEALWRDGDYVASAFRS